MRHPRLSLTGKFAVLSFVVIAATGVLVGAVLHERIQHRALLQAERLAVGVARVGLQGCVSRALNRDRSACLPPSSPGSTVCW